METAVSRRQQGAGRSSSRRRSRVGDGAARRRRRPSSKTDRFRFLLLASARLCCRTETKEAYEAARVGSGDAWAHAGTGQLCRRGHDGGKENETEKKCGKAGGSILSKKKKERPRPLLSASLLFLFFNFFLSRDQRRPAVGTLRERSRGTRKCLFIDNFCLFIFSDERKQDGGRFFWGGTKKSTKKSGATPLLKPRRPLRPCRPSSRSSSTPWGPWRASGPSS